MPPKLIHILLVEDNPLDAELFQEGLAQARGVEFVLIRVERLEEALEQLRRQDFDVVVLDVGLPDSKGLEGLEKIRATAHAIPILLFTGLDDEAMALSALQQGAQDYLIKGRADDQAVTRAIRYAIERKHGEELERAKEALEAANRAKDHFLAVLSHELRNPLTPVLPALATLEQLVFPEGREYLDMARRNVELEARLIDDLLDVTRIARGKVELDRRPVELTEIVQRAAEVCAPDIEARGLHFGILSDNDPYYVHADAARLQQVFWNLIKNAVKFTRPGGCVGVRCQRQDGWAKVQVADSGVGMDAEALPRIFNAFEQEDRWTTREFGGLGLGLAISKALVEMHGGRIAAYSEGRDKGATFTVELPMVHVPPPSETQAATSAESAASRRSLKILLVEDHGDTARILSRLLRADGHQVQHAGDVATALDLAQSQSFDLLLSDLGLPDGSGHDLMRQLVAKGHHLPAIALSGYGMATDMQHSREAGFAQHLTKPVNLDRLRSVIAKVTT